MDVHNHGLIDLPSQIIAKAVAIVVIAAAAYAAICMMVGIAHGVLSGSAIDSIISMTVIRALEIIVLVEIAYLIAGTAERHKTSIPLLLDTVTTFGAREIIIELYKHIHFAAMAITLLTVAVTIVLRTLYSFRHQSEKAKPSP